MFKIISMVMLLAGGSWLVTLTDLYFVLSGGSFLIVGFCMFFDLLLSSTLPCRFGYHKWESTFYAEQRRTGHSFVCSKCKKGR